MIKWTKTQESALKLFSKEKIHYLFPGGARSGKTFFIVCCILIRALKYPGSRHLMARHRFNHAKVSIWMDTIPKALKLLGLAKIVTEDKTNTVLKFFNGSEIWIDGLDSSDRVEKILGREYCTIFFNEISQIDFDTVALVRTRLAQKIDGCHNIFLYDCNPTGRGHWAYKEFILGLNPQTDEKYPDSFYIQFVIQPMSPYDNAENLPEGFIENNLETLPEAKRKRFLLGEWNDPEGVIFQNWSVVQDVPDDVKRHSRRSIGVDFGFSVDPAAVIDCYLSGNNLYLDELVYETGLINSVLAKRIKEHEIGFTPAYCDSAEPKSITDLKNAGINAKEAVKGHDSVRSGIDYLLGLSIFITRRSANLILEFQNYTWRKDRNGKTLPEPIDDFNHGIDATRYGVFDGNKPKMSAPNTRLRGALGI